MFSLACTSLPSGGMYAGVPAAAVTEARAIADILTSCCINLLRPKSLILQWKSTLMRMLADLRSRCRMGGRQLCIAQEAWLGLLRGIDRFEGRSSLRTWLFRIVINRAISTGIRESVHLPVADDELEMNDGRFSQDGWWVTPPTHWADEVLDRVAAPALVARVQEVIAQLPPLQRSVVTLRDVEGLTSAEACKVLDITEINQRVQLHRARTRIRSVLEQEVLP